MTAWDSRILCFSIAVNKHKHTHTPLAHSIALTLTLSLSFSFLFRSCSSVIWKCTFWINSVFVDLFCTTATSVVCPAGTHLTGNETCLPCEKQNFRSSSHLSTLWQSTRRTESCWISVWEQENFTVTLDRRLKRWALRLTVHRNPAHVQHTHTNLSICIFLNLLNNETVSVS